VSLATDKRRLSGSNSGRKSTACPSSRGGPTGPAIGGIRINITAQFYRFINHVGPRFPLGYGLESVMKVRSRVAASAVLFGCLVGAGGGARADHQPVIALPGNWQVPVVIDGALATGAYVSGDWGLYAPGRVTPEIYGPIVLPAELYVPGYYPSMGRRPRYGRQEVIIRRPARPGPSFHREWSSDSGYGPATEYPPFDPPPVILAPRGRH